MNGAYLDPATQTLTIYAQPEDVTLEKGDDQVLITVAKLDEGIEIPHDGPVWRGLGTPPKKKRWKRAK